ncbi:retrovirus-related pol polyprotein from transposon TNT 1-94 [Tanacetum coccineum]
MSLMEEMKFFLGLQIHQSPKGIFINQSKYALEILKKHNMDNCHSIGTPLATKPKLDVDFSGEPVDQYDYHSKIGSLVCLTSSRPDLVTSGGIQFLGDKLVSWMSRKQNCHLHVFSRAEYVALSAKLCQESNPMIQPEQEDLPRRIKLELAVLRRLKNEKDKCMDKGLKKESPHNFRQKTGQYICCPESQGQLAQLRVLIQNALIESEPEINQKIVRTHSISNHLLNIIKVHKLLSRVSSSNSTAVVLYANALGDLTVTLKDPSGTISGTIHHKIINEGDFGKAITVRVVLILGNVSVFSPKQSIHALNTTRANLVKVLHKDTIPGESLM